MGGYRPFLASHKTHLFRHHTCLFRAMKHLSECDPCAHKEKWVFAWSDSHFSLCAHGVFSLQVIGQRLQLKIIISGHRPYFIKDFQPSGYPKKIHGSHGEHGERFSLRFRAVRQSIINSSPKARYSSAFSVEILVKDYNSLRKNVTQIFWSSEDRVKARFHYVESRQNKPKANHGNHGKIFIENVQQYKRGGIHIRPLLQMTKNQIVQISFSIILFFFTLQIYE